MPRRARAIRPDSVHHVLNRAHSRKTIFRTDGDYLAFVKALFEAHRHVPIRILAFIIMPNHFHLVLWPKTARQLSEFMRRLTQAHAQRWRHAHNSVGDGPLYQGRFKAFVVQEDEHLLIVCRYVERNALRARLVRRAEDWRWSSVWVRLNGEAAIRGLLTDWPVDAPGNWLQVLNSPQTDAEEEALRTSMRRSRPFGGAAWTSRTARQLGLQHTVRPPGRPSAATARYDSRRRRAPAS
jgi:putative transposase